MSLTEKRAQPGNSTNRSDASAASRSSRQQHRGNQVASLIAARQPETLAEQLLAVQEYNNELQEQLKHALAEVRHKDTEIKRCRQDLLAAEGLLQHHGQTTAVLQPDLGQDGSRKQSPRRAATAALTCTQQSCLIGALKDQNAALKQTISELQQQHMQAAQPELAAQQVESLQQQLQVAVGQLQQQQHVVHELSNKAEEAQMVAQAASAQVANAEKALHEVWAAAAAAVQGGGLDGAMLGHNILTLINAVVKAPHPDAAGLNNSTKALAAAQDAHKLLLQQALMLRGRLPESATAFVCNPYGSSRHRSGDGRSSVVAGRNSLGSSTGGLTHISGCADEDVAAAAAAEGACGRISGAGMRNRSPSQCGRGGEGAVELLQFLKSHVARLQATLDSLPGATAALVEASRQQQQQCEALNTYPASVATAPADGCDYTSWQQQQQYQMVRPASAGVYGASHPAEQGIGSPQFRIRPYSAQVPSINCQRSSDNTLGVKIPSAMRSTAATVSRKASACRPQQQHSVAKPDLSPYTKYPPKRPLSPKAKELAALHETVLQLEALVHEQEQQMEAQQMCMQQQAGDMLQLQQVIVDMQEQLEASQQRLLQSREAAIAEGQQLQGIVQRVQDHSTALQQQLAAEQQQVVSLQQNSKALHEELAGGHQQVAQLQQSNEALQQQLAAEQQHVVQLQQYNDVLQQQIVAEQQQVEPLQKQLNDVKQQVLNAEETMLQMRKAAHEDAAAGQQQLQHALQTVQQHVLIIQQQKQYIQQQGQQLVELSAEHQQCVERLEQQERDSSSTTHLAQCILHHAEMLSKLSEQAVPSEAANWQQLSEAMAALLDVLQKALGVGAYGQGGLYAVNTEQLEEQLAESAAAVDECMLALQEVCEISRRASAAGPAILQLNPGGAPVLNPVVKRMSQAGAIPAATLNTATMGPTRTSVINTVDTTIKSPADSSCGDDEAQVAASRAQTMSRSNSGCADGRNDSSIECVTDQDGKSKSEDTSECTPNSATQQEGPAVGVSCIADRDREADAGCTANTNAGMHDIGEAIATPRTVGDDCVTDGSCYMDEDSSLKHSVQGGSSADGAAASNPGGIEGCQAQVPVVTGDRGNRSDAGASSTPQLLSMSGISVTPTDGAAGGDMLAVHS